MIADFVSLLLLLYSPELFFIVWLEMDPYKPESRQRKDRDDDKSKSGQDYGFLGYEEEEEEEEEGGSELCGRLHLQQGILFRSMICKDFLYFLNFNSYISYLPLAIKKAIA